MKKFKIDKIILIESILLAFSFLIGKTIYNHGIIDPLFQHFSSLFYFIGLTTLFYIWISFLYVLLDTKKGVKKSNKLYHFIFEYKPFLIPFLIFFIWGLWYVICFYPGAVQWDGLEEINNYYGIIRWTTHHPVFPTILMGLSMKIGTSLINNNFGIFIFNFCQYTISAFIFAYIIKYLGKIKAPRFFITITFLFFLLNPVWLANSYTLIKDTYYYLFFAIFVIEFFEYYHNKSNFARFLISGFLVILFRNNGVYVVLPSLLLMTIFKKERNYYVFSIFVLLFISTFAVSIITKKAGILDGDIREALSVPIQTTGRYIKYHELDEEELTFYNEIIYGGLARIKDNYDPNSADKIKWFFYITQPNYTRYAKFWLLGLKRAPKTYFDAVLANYYGYIYPYKEVHFNEIAYFDVVSDPQPNVGYFDLYLNPYTENIRKGFNKYFDLITTFPVTRLMFRPGTYTIVFILALFYAIWKKQKGIFLLSTPMFLTLLFCFLSPINACLRYINPLVIALSILWGYILRKDGK